MTSFRTTAILNAALIFTWLSAQTWCAEAGADTQTKPIASYNIDAGMMYPGELRVVNFLPRVSQDFTVLGVRNSCSCMLTGAVPTTLSPTNTQELSIVLQGAESPQDTRQYTWIDVRDDHGQLQVLQATITSSTADPLQWDVAKGGFQRAIDLGVATNQASPVVWNSRIGHGPHPMPWTQIHARVISGESWLEATITSENDGQHLHVTPRHQIFSGALQGRIQLTLDDQHGKALPYQPVYPVKYVIRGNVAPVPSIALFGSVVPGIQESLTIRLRANDGVLPAIEKMVSSNPDQLTAEQREEVIHLHFNGKPPSGAFHEYIDIQFITGAILRVPVIGAVVATRP